MAPENPFIRPFSAAVALYYNSVPLTGYPPPDIRTPGRLTPIDYLHLRRAIIFRLFYIHRVETNADESYWF